MRLIVSLLLVAAFGLFGCSTPGSQASDAKRKAMEDASKRYQQLSSQATPSSWREGASWAFVALDEKGNVMESFVFRLTDAPQKACLSGDWRKLEVVSGDATQLQNPAYSVEGRNVEILLSTAMCDAYPAYRGELSQKGFTGKHDFSGLMGGESTARCTGCRLMQTRECIPGYRSPPEPKPSRRLAVTAFGR